MASTSQANSRRYQSKAPSCTISKGYNWSRGITEPTLGPARPHNSLKLCCRILLHTTRKRSQFGAQKRLNPCRYAKSICIRSTLSYNLYQMGNTPINEVPAEVLAKIFEVSMCWKPAGFSPHNMLLPSRRILDGYAPMIYLKVCKYWREVALSTSSLWTTISSEQFCPKATLIPVMKTWLDRSSLTAPLDLQLIFQDNFPPLYANNIFQFLTTKVGRWRSMSIELDSSLSEEFAALLEQRTQDLSQLKELEVHLLPKGVPVTVSQRILSQIPILKSLRRFSWTANGRESRDHAFRHLRALSTLDDITLYTPSLLDECIMHLSQCISASRVRLYDHTCHYYPLQRKPQFPMTTLPRLTSLTLSRYFDPTDVLSYFTLPSLEYLELATGHPPGHNLTILETFLSRSECRLRTLVIGGHCGMLDSNIIDYLLFLPIRSIPVVEIACSNVSNRMLTILETYPNAETIFPPIISWVPNANRIIETPSIGWKDLAAGEKLVYSWKAGKLDLTEFWEPARKPEPYIPRESCASQIGLSP